MTRFEIKRELEATAEIVQLPRRAVLSLYQPLETLDSAGRNISHGWLGFAAHAVGVFAEDISFLKTSLSGPYGQVIAAVDQILPILAELEYPCEEESEALDSVGTLFENGRMVIRVYGDRILAGFADILPQTMLGILHTSVVSHIYTNV